MDPLRYQILKETNLLEVMFGIASCTSPRRGIPLAIQSPKLRMGIGTSKTMRFRWFFLANPNHSLTIWRLIPRGVFKTNWGEKKTGRFPTSRLLRAGGDDGTDGSSSSKRSSGATAPGYGMWETLPLTGWRQMQNFWDPHGSTIIWAFYVWILNLNDFMPFLGRIFG